MQERSYSSEIAISADPASVYSALTNHIDKWWTQLSDQASQVGEPLNVRFEKTTAWAMTVSEAIPGRSLVWTVIEANHELEGIPTKDEWKGQPSSGQ